MRSVYLWACPCGNRNKAICEYDPAMALPTTSIVCQHCKRVMRLDGELLQLYTEAEDGTWSPVSCANPDG